MAQLGPVTDPTHRMPKAAFDLQDPGEFSGVLDVISLRQPDACLLYTSDAADE